MIRVLAHLALLPLGAWALVTLFDVSSDKASVGIATWLLAAGDRAARLALRGAINYVRVPAGLSLLLLVVFWGTIAGKGGGAYRAVSGREYDGYATRWLLVTAALFAASALVFLVRRGSGRHRRLAR